MEQKRFDHGKAANKERVTLGRLLLAAALSLSAIVIPTSVAAERVTTDYWVGPLGDDDRNDGSTPETPLGSLQAVHDRICPSNPCLPLGVGIRVYLMPGAHPQTSTVWKYFDENFPTQFIGPHSPLFPLQLEGPITPAVLDGAERIDYGFTFVPGRHSTNGMTRIEFHGIEWQGFVRAAIHMRTSAIPFGGGNRFIGNTFHDIGNYGRAHLPRAWGAVLVLRINGIEFRENSFIRILNSVEDGIGHEHAIYLVRSSNSQIVNNTFHHVGGDAIRFRDRSNGNVVTGNTFVKAGGKGFVGDWYCSGTHVAQNLCGPEEFRSVRNVVRKNAFISRYGRGYPATFTAYCHDLNRSCPTHRIHIQDQYVGQIISTKLPKR